MKTAFVIIISGIAAMTIVTGKAIALAVILNFVTAASYKTALESLADPVPGHPQPTRPIYK